MHSETNVAVPVGAPSKEIPSSHGDISAEANRARVSMLIPRTALREIQ